MWNWIPISERTPGKEDADVYGCVIVWHVYQGVMVTGWRTANDNRFISHWAPTPEPPKDAKALYYSYKRT